MFELLITFVLFGAGLITLYGIYAIVSFILLLFGIEISAD